MPWPLRLPKRSSVSDVTVKESTPSFATTTVKVTLAPLSGMAVSLAVLVTVILGKKSTVTEAVSVEVAVDDSHSAVAVAVLMKLAITFDSEQE